MTSARRVLVIAGGEWQVPLVRKIRQMGHVVFNSNLYPDSPAFAFADGTLVADVRDRAANLIFAASRHVDAVLTDQSDIAVPTVAYICDQLGLAGIGAEGAELFTNKARMRAFGAANGFPTPRYKVCEDLAPAIAWANEIGFPCVLKPSANQASRGVTKVSGLAGLEAAFAEAKRCSFDGAVLVEEFIGGTELTVEGIKLPAQHYSLAVSRKTHYAHNPMVANRLFYSYDDPDIDYERLRRQNDKLVEAMGLPFGVTHAEYKFDRGQFYLVEIAARGGGTRISSDIVPLMSGYDSNEVLVRMALGETVPPPVLRATTRCAALDFWDFPPGRIKAIHGLEAVLACPGVIAAALKVAPGDTLRAAADDTSRHGYVIAWDRDRQRLEIGLTKLRAMLAIEYEPPSA